MDGPGVLKAIQYLSADYQPTISQTPAGITKLVKELAPFELTKAEKLQVVNLAPTEPVELYVVCRISRILLAIFLLPRLPFYLLICVFYFIDR